VTSAAVAAPPATEEPAEQLISKCDARALTESIRQKLDYASDVLEDVGRLLEEVRTRRAWEALGYPSFEDLRLTVDRVDFLRRSLAVDRQLVLLPGAPPCFGPPKTRSSHRTVRVPQFTIDTLAADLAEFGEDRTG
jgi:hypothetical protein